MTAPVRGRPRSAEAEQAIREAAAELLSERGIGGFSVEAVAARAGVAKTTVYRRWPTREELLVAVVSGLKAPAEAAPGDSVRGDLLHFLRSTAYEDRSGRWTRLMNRLLVDADEYPELVADVWRQSVRPRREYLAGILRRAVAEGLVRPGADLDLLVDLLISPVTSRIRLRRGRLSDDQLAELVDTVLRGAAP
ncbi:MAG TPA: TetR/AcrR family transcriptional regulator [Mycobacteriales bacterium]|jgi:AcrR family transcriptional regulator|nr:TetR/AcrR family transcriptional regulator [Mycobacteriales bacterium]